MSPLWLIFLIGPIVSLILLWLIQYFKYRKYLWKFSGPSCLPIIGNVHHLKMGKDLVPSLMQCVQKHPEVTKFLIGFKMKLLLSGRKSIETVLASTTIMAKSYDYRYLHPWLGLGLLTSSGAKWKQSRKFLTPAFHFQILKQFLDIFEKQSKILENILETVVGKEVNIYPYITRFALDTICEATMNTPINSQLDSESDYVLSVKEICRIIHHRALSLIKRFDFLYRFTEDYKAELKALRILHGQTNMVIERRKWEIDRMKLDGNEFDKNKKLTFLDLLLSSRVDGKPLRLEIIREEVDTFMFAGHDTTTAGISFTFYMLSKHPEVQEKVFEEVESIAQGNQQFLTYENLQQMKYLEQVIKETLRLFPPVPIFSRMLSEDTDFDGVKLPKGLNLTIFAYALHRCPELYPNPDVFDPERFNLENSKNRSVYAYIPFSAGSRNCIGQRFAMLEMKSVVSKLIRKFRLLPVPGHEPALLAEIVLKSQNGLPVRLLKR